MIDSEAASLSHGNLPPRLLAAAIAVIVAIPLAWVVEPSTETIWPDSQRGLQGEATFALIAALAAGLAAVLVTRMAIRHPSLVILELALLTQAIGIVFQVLVWSNGNSGAFLCLPFGPFGCWPVTPYVIAGAVIWALLFRTLGPLLISKEDTDSAMGAAARDGRTLAWTTVLTVCWYAIGLMILGAFSGQQGI
ncbi:MAG TPA: hypothetical protein VF337_00990 [Candidatus Limnocylindrales bacterium]